MNVQMPRKIQDIIKKFSAPLDLYFALGSKHTCIHIYKDEFSNHFWDICSNKNLTAYCRTVTSTWLCIIHPRVYRFRQTTGLKKSHDAGWFVISLMPKYFLKKTIHL